MAAARAATNALNPNAVSLEVSRVRAYTKLSLFAAARRPGPSAEPSMRWIFATLVLLVTAFVAGCGPAHAPPPRNLPPPTPSTTVGPGDVFEVFVMGEQNLPKEFRVQPDGSINFPYLEKISVTGMEPQDIAELVKRRLREEKILQNPQVSVIVKAYNSKKITVLGQVAKPGSLGFVEGMKLVEAISLSGGFTPLADGRHVILTRNVSPTKTVTAIISVDAITDGAQADIPLQSGDTIKVEQKVF
jgi:polysaccharide export outer membrane protein